MDRLTLAKELIDMAYAMDMWIFGGYVRDVVVRQEQKFGDIDICCSRNRTNSSQFIRMLSARYDVTLHDERKFKYTYGAMSPGIKKIHKCTVTVGDVHVRVDVVSFDGTFADWCHERTVDFTCNLFYTKSDVALGLRYVPDFLKHDSSPIARLVEMTENHEFHRTWDVSNRSTCQCMNVIRIHDRAKELVKRGWYMRSTPTLMSELMSFEIIEKQYAQQECSRSTGIIERIQSLRAIRMLEQYTGESNAVTSRIRRFVQ